MSVDWRMTPSMLAHPSNFGCTAATEKMKTSNAASRPFAARAHVDRRDQYGTHDDLLHEFADSEDQQPRLEYPHEEHAGHDSGNGSHAAAEVHTAQKYGRDHGQREALADAAAGQPEFRHAHNRNDAPRQPGCAVHQELQAPHLHAHEKGHPFVLSGRVERAPRPAHVQEPPAQGQHRQHDVDLGAKPQDFIAKRVEKRRRRHSRLASRDGKRQAAKDEAGAHRDNDRIEAGITHEKPVHDSGAEADAEERRQAAGHSGRVHHFDPDHGRKPDDGAE